MEQIDSPAKVASNDGLGHADEARWYCVSRDGLATLCKDAEDAHETTGQCDKSWPAGGPHRAVLLVDADEISILRSALLVAQGALVQCSPCASPECQADQREWLDDAIAGCERALKA